MSAEPDPELVRLAAQTYVYGYPLAYNLTEIADYVGGGGRLPMHAPLNAFGHARMLADHDAKFVSVNNDTLYSVAMCDVRSEPLVLHVPDTRDRYYVLQFVDAWTNNFAYIGRRATGTAAADFLLTEPGYDGPVPDGMAVVRAPSGVFAIVGRIAVHGAPDVPAVHALQDALTVTPLAVHEGGAAAPLVGLPKPDPRVPDSLAWWERFRVALAAFPPPAADAALLAAARPLGVTAADSPYVDADAVLARALAAGAAAGQERIEELMQQVRRTPEGWQPILHIFDYNLDHFGVGTIDAPEWRIADRTVAYATRAVAARAGLWGNHGYEAAYALAWVDTDGQPLHGAYRYELRLTQVPPVDAFWSLTMYGVPEFYLIENPIGRFSIGSETPGLTRDPDGSLTLYLQHESPGPEREANWLPTPAEAFRPIIRMYQPRASVLDETYRLPGIRRVG